MNLESLPKFYSPKSPKLNDSTPATGGDALTITDVMAAQGMVQQRAELGFSAFLGKMGISINDQDKAISLLAEYALAHCDKVAALRKLEDSVKPQVMRILATFAFEDYSRSSSSKKACGSCDGSGFVEATVFTNKVNYPYGKPPEWAKVTRGVHPSDWEAWQSVREVQRVVCKPCNGKGSVSVACSDCRGRGKAINKEKSERAGAPVISDCLRCGGRGYERVPSTEVHRAICGLTDAISLDTWKKSVKKFYDSLSMLLDIEESEANAALRAATK
ncbi:antitermination protein [Salmonella enterica subsp. enterica serovar Sundsvall]|nr:antitermination protein [Salmonella enterica subsp. enterica serovar Sundsvall]